MQRRRDAFAHDIYVYNDFYTVLIKENKKKNMIY